MKKFNLDRVMFAVRIILVLALFALTLAACLFGSSAVSGGAEFDGYLPHVEESESFRAYLIGSLAAACALFVTYPFKRKQSLKPGEGNDSKSSPIGSGSTISGVDGASTTGDGACLNEEQSSALTEEDGACLNEEQGSALTKRDGNKLMSKAATVLDRIAGYLSIIPATCSFYVFYFALSDESLGAWANAILITSLFCAVFFFAKIIKRAKVARLISGIGVFLFSALVIASLYLDHVIEINSDFKLLIQFGIAGMIISTLADLRSDLSRITAGRSIALKSFALILCAICPAVILSIPRDAGLFPSSYFVYALLCLSCLIPIALETVSQLLLDGSRRM